MMKQLLHQQKWYEISILNVIFIRELHLSNELIISLIFFSQFSGKEVESYELKDMTFV